MRVPGLRTVPSHPHPMTRPLLEFFYRNRTSIILSGSILIGLYRFRFRPGKCFINSDHRHHKQGGTCQDLCCAETRSGAIEDWPTWAHSSAAQIMQQKAPLPWAMLSKLKSRRKNIVVDRQGPCVTHHQDPGHCGDKYFADPGSPAASPNQVPRVQLWILLWRIWHVNRRVQF